MKRRIVLLAASLALAAACTGGGSEGQGTSASPTSEPWRGGTLRLALVKGYYFSAAPRAALDPQLEYDGNEWELLRCCLVRTLFSYNGLPASEGGAEALPDLTAGPPEVSTDGLTWTFRIKPGIHYAPPLEDVEITAQDFVRALMRTAGPGKGWGQDVYFSVIEGFDAYMGGDATTISGLETPDEHTLVVRLTEPADDLPNRFALAATAPIPANPYRPEEPLGAAQGHDTGYGRFLVASGPYMIEGSQDLDLSLPAADQKPIAGYSLPRVDVKGNIVTPGSLTFVRNPSWSSTTDDLRAAYADRIEIRIGGDPEELASAVEAGTVDHVPDQTYTTSQIRTYRADPEMEGRVTSGPDGFIYSVALNLGVPPFDNVHVRRAIALSIDEAEILRSLRADPMARSYQWVAATHLTPDDLEGDLLADYDPYPTSLERARQEMALSRYDTDHDGLCDAPECGGVLALAHGNASLALAEVAASLEGIGISLRLEVDHGQYFDAREQVPLAMFALAYDYPNAYTVFESTFSSSSITDGFNTSLVGAAPSQLRRWGYEVTTVPSADDRIDRCTAMVGGDQTECWVELDRYLMEDMVPWVPCIATLSTDVVSRRVATYSAATLTRIGLALDRIALVPGSE